MMGPHGIIPLWHRIENTKEFRDMLKNAK
jgi:hypothetical protein